MMFRFNKSTNLDPQLFIAYSGSGYTWTFKAATYNRTELQDVKNKKKIKSALVVEGGGMRGLFSAGVLHAFGREGFDPYDLYIGVSAGACNLAAHLAGQNTRNIDIALRYSATRRFISMRRFLFGGHLMDLDWLWYITIMEYRLNLKFLFDKLKREKKTYLVVATSAASGDPLYLEPDEHNLEHYLKVSSSIPFLYRNILDVEGVPATDGGIADSIPVIESANRGAVDITVIRSRPSSYVMKKSSLTAIYPFLLRKNSGLVEAMNNRYINYMKSVEFIHNPPPGIRVKEIAPPENLVIGRSTRDKAVIKSAYEHGIVCGEKHMVEKGKIN